MTNQSTIDKLIEMRLTAMADAFRIQMDDPTMKEVPFENRFGMLVDIEYSNRKNNRLKRLIRQAEFEQPDASIAAIDYQSGRKLNKALISRLATCEYITEYRNIFITGATGSGKTYMACAFGMEACKHYYTVRYVRLLEYNGTYYTAQAVPELQDLFSYHGFSVRYTGNTGLRCSFGIDTTKKSQLISTGGMGGYRLTEMGTLIMNPDNRNNYPMVHGGDKVAGGRTFYIENGKTYNKVIRTVNGREQFANVLVGLPPSRYATNYVFRAYAVMEHNGTQVVIYGSEMSRSMYTVCKQILDRGDFKQGSAGYAFLKNITDSVETTR